MAGSRTQLPEIFGTEAAPRATLTRWVAEGRIRRITSGIYTNNLIDPLEKVVRRNMWQLVARIAPDAVVSDRTALEGQPAPDGSVFIISSRARPAELPGIVIRPRAGHQALKEDGAGPADMPLPGGIHMASRARAILENLRPARRARGVARALTRVELEAMLERTLRTSDDVALNRLRDEARAIAPALGHEAEFARLDTLIGALQGTRQAELSTPQGQARMRGAGYDADRVDRFTRLHEHLRSLAPITRPAPPTNADQVHHLPFFEAYFSNFIEGTEFRLDEAASIVYDKEIPAARPEDAHDIVGTYRILSDAAEMSAVPGDADHFIELLKTRHAVLLSGRPDKRPGQFKLRENRAGGTHFVLPTLVEGTLRAAFDLYRSLETPFERACYLMFVVAEVHPFDDGNGRTARIMMNAEFVATGEWRIIVPTIYRNNYLQALRALTHNTNPVPLPRMLDFAQRYTAAMDYTSIENAEQMLKRTNAFVDANAADEQGIRLQLPTAADYDTMLPN